MTSQHVLFHPRVSMIGIAQQYTEEEEPEEPEEIAVEEEEQPDEVQAEEPAAQDVAVSQQEPAPAAPANKPAAAPSKGPMSWAALASKNCPTVPVAPPKYEPPSAPSFSRLFMHFVFPRNRSVEYQHGFFNTISGTLASAAIRLPFVCARL